MADLSGYTAWTARHGAEAAASIIDTYCRLVNDSLVGASEVCERVGDQVVVTSPNPNGVAATVVQLYKKTQDQHHFLPVHAGIHYGEILRREKFLFGSTINVCSRLATAAREGGILCSSEFVYALKDRRPYYFVRRGLKQFKNVFEQTDVMEFMPQGFSGKRVKLIDPVCHMQLEENEDHFRYRHRQHISHFCSIECMNVFQQTLHRKQSACLA